MRINRLFLSTLIVFAGSFIAHAQPGKTTPATTTAPTTPPATAPATAPSPSPMTVKRVEVYTTADQQWCGAPTATPANQQKAVPVPTPPCEAGIGDTVIVTVENLQSNNAKLSDLVILVNGRPLKGLTSRWWKTDQIAFDLKRTDGSSDSWSALLSQPGFDPFRTDVVSVSWVEKPLADSAPNDPPTIRLRVYRKGWAIFSFIALILTLGLFFYLAKRTGIIRDPGPPRVATTDRPYSLARAQAAFWFFLVIGSFVFLYLITRDYNTITEQALILMGIGTGTALGSAMIDASKNDTANSQLGDLKPQQAQLQGEVGQLQAKVTAGTATPDEKVQLDTKNVQLAEIKKKIDDAESGLSKPTSDGFGNDLLTDVNGINFHRFQMVVWTVVLGFLFCAGVYSTLAMPQFSGTLLALMGISAGTYLGFKIPEKQN